jgi:hypothetical protein
VLVFIYLLQKFNNLTYQNSPTKVYNRVSNEIDDVGLIEGKEYNFDLMFYWTSLGTNEPITVPKRIFDV